MFRKCRQHLDLEMNLVKFMLVASQVVLKSFILMSKCSYVVQYFLTKCALDNLSAQKSGTGQANGSW